MEYRTIAFSNSKKLDKFVNDLLEKGWKLYESPYSLDGYMIQALTKESEIRYA